MLIGDAVKRTKGMFSLSHRRLLTLNFRLVFMGSYDYQIFENKNAQRWKLMQMQTEYSVRMEEYFYLFAF